MPQRETWIYRNGKMVRRTLAQSHSGGVMIIQDDIPDLVHPANGKRYSSKSRFRDETRARGLIEFGNEHQTRNTPDISPVGPAVKQAIERLRSGYRPPPLEGPNIPRGEFAALPMTRVKHG